MEKRWTMIFRALANINRVKIIKILSKDIKLNVSQISAHLKISLKSTSKHLIILRSLDVLENEGAKGHVFYGINPGMPSDIKKTIKLFT